MKVSIYTDASSSQQKDISACGYVIRTYSRILKHDVLLVDELKDINEAECYAVYLSLLEALKLKWINRVDIFTDSSIVLDAINGIIVKAFQNSKYFILLTETLISYNELGIKVKSKKVKSHSGNYNNSKVDMSVRKELRNYLKLAA